MIKPIFELNNQIIDPPVNWEELSVELNFDKDSPNFAGQVSITQWDIGLGDKNNPKDGAAIIKKYIDGGLTDDVGVFEGIPFNIRLQDGSSIEDLFQGFLDISEAEITCDRINASATETGRIDWLNTVADSFTFEYLYDQQGLSQERVKAINDAVGNNFSKMDVSDFVKVPYVLSSIPDTQQIFTLTLSIFVVTQELIDTWQEWQTVSLPFTADWLEFGNLIALIGLTIKNVLLIIALIKLIDQILDILIQPIKYKNAMYVVDSCKFGAKYLGFTDFKSQTILDKDPYNKLVIIPESYAQFENEPSTNNVADFVSDHILGVTDSRTEYDTGFFRGTFGDLLRELKLLFNAKIVIDGNILRLEDQSYVLTSNQWQIPDIDLTDSPYKFNSEDFISHYNLSFTPDLNDKNVWQNYQGTEVQVITAPKRFNNRRNVLNKGERILKSSFAIGRRKVKLTFVEKFIRNFVADTDRLIGFAEEVINDTVRPINKLIKAAKKIVKFLNTVPPPLSGNILNNFNPPRLEPFRFDWRLSDIININKRFNTLLLENDFINVPKLVMLNTTNKNQNQDTIRVDARNPTVVNADSIYEEFHSVESFVGADPNQYIIRSLSNVPFCIDDYKLVRNNSYIRDASGKQAEVISVKWNVFKGTADVTYKVKQKYTDNLEQFKVLSDGR